MFISWANYLIYLLYKYITNIHRVNCKKLKDIKLE